MINTWSRMSNLNDWRKCLHTSSSIASSHATDKPTENKRCQSRGVWTMFDRTGNVVLSFYSTLANHFRGIRGSFFCLPIEVLCRACRLVDDAFNLAPRVPSDATKTFLRLAAEISCGGANYTIFSHRSTSLRNGMGKQSAFVKNAINV
jgi:hypothetical protein